MHKSIEKDFEDFKNSPEFRELVNKAQNLVRKTKEGIIEDLEKINKIFK